MATEIQLKRSSVVGKVPDAANVLVGEPVVNLADRVIYTKDGTGNVILIGAGNISSLADVSNATPSADQVLSWNASINKWEPKTSSVVGGNVNSVAGATGDISNAQLVAGITTAGVLTTANVSELTNLYYTDARAYANVTQIGYATNSNVALKANIADLTTSNVSEGTNLYFTNTRAVSAFTPGTGITLDANGLITSTTTGGVSNAINTISVIDAVGGNIVAVGSTTLKIQAQGLLEANTDPTTNTLSLSVGDVSLPFYNTSSILKPIILRVEGGTSITEAINTLYLPFVLGDGTPVTTLRV